MTARYRIEHTSRFQYDQEVTASFNEARLTPLASRRQSPLESTVRVDPATWQHQYVDYWGTQVRVFEVSRPHRELLVAARSLVEVDDSIRQSAAATLSWDELSERQVREEYGEFLAATQSTRSPDDLTALTREIAANASPADAALAVSAAVHEQMIYQPGSTGVSTVAAEAWAARSGVCQDYAHLVVGALRELGIPARYVSGYLHPSKQPEIGEAVVGESHAWVQWWLGAWIGHDPTNDAVIGDRHVMVGAGRDYSDVPPIKGIVAGTPVTTELQVSVEITRVA
jgi:transglutaminase-like putative cysteine protease